MVEEMLDWGMKGEKVEGYSDNKGVRQSDKNVIAELLPENTSKPLIYTGFCLRLMQFLSQ